MWLEPHNKDFTIYATRLFVVVQALSRVRLFAIPWTAAGSLQPSRPLLPPSPFAFNCSRKRWYSNIFLKKKTNMEFGICRCKLLYREWISSEVLLYNTESYTKYPEINQNGKECGKECVYIYTTHKTLFLY